MPRSEQQPPPAVEGNTYWHVITTLGRIRPMENEGDFEPGDTLLRIRADGRGNIDVMVRRTVHEVEINIEKRLT